MSHRFISTATLLVALATSSPAAHADQINPLHDLVDTAAQRLATADGVAAYKWINGGSITDPARVAQILDSMGSAATNQGLPAPYVRQIFTDQIGATEGVEYALFAHWKFDPSDAPATAPDLSASRSAIDGYNTTMINEIAANRGVLDGPECHGDVDGAVAAVVAERALDNLYQRALTSATRSYCEAI